MPHVDEAAAHDLSRSEFRFELEEQRGAARLGRIVTPHGVIATPSFVPVGTQASVKGLAPDQLAKTEIGRAHV